MNLIKSACILFLFITTVAYSQLRINEVCASNSASLFDEDSDTPDWIELYNYSTEAVSLKDWRISDENDFDKAWQFPDTIMQPGSYLIVFASGKDRYGSGLYAMNMKSYNAIVSHNNRDGFRLKYTSIVGDFEAELSVKSMDKEKRWGSAGIQIREKLTDTTNFFAILASSKEKHDFTIKYRDKILAIPSWIPIYGGTNLPYTQLWLQRKNDSLYFTYKDRAGKLINIQTLKNFLADTLIIGVSISGNNPDEYAKFVFGDFTINNEIIKLDKLPVYEVNAIEPGFDIIYNELHSNFSIKDDETLFLFKSSKLSDSVALQTMTGDITNIFSGNGNWLITDKFTPGSKNSGGYFGRLSKPIISFKDGKLQITDTNNAVIRYTTDNSYPTINSKIFIQNQTIIFDKTTTVKAVVFKENYLPSFASSNIYFINEPETTLPIVSISADSNDLWGKEGIINDLFGLCDANMNLFLQNNQVEFNQSVRIKIHGQSTKYLPQKSLRVYADDKKEDNRIKNILFNKSKLKEYDQLVLRNGGQDWNSTFIKDGFCAVIASKMENQIYAAYKPALIYLNSEFYGLTNLRERLEDDYLADLFDINDFSINYIKNNGSIDQGDFLSYYNYFKKINELDFTIEDNYNRINQLVDIKNIIDYSLLYIYSANGDWPSMNVKAFSSSEIDNKFRYLINDMDITFGYGNDKANYSKLEQLLNDTINDYSLISKKFLTNKKFKTEFMTRACDLVNSVFKTTNMVEILDSLSNQIRPYIPLQQERWEESCVNWEEKLNEMKFFLKERPYYFMKNLNYHLNDDIGTSNFNLSTYPPNSGTFKVNTINVDTSEWSGRYFQILPVTITAIPKHGMKFIKWNHDSLGTNATITTTLPELIDLEAIYEKAEPTNQATYIVINEIMYNADKSAETKDWVELYNVGKESVNLNGWSLIDEDITHEIFVINEDYSIKPDEYVILTKEKKEFEKYITITNKIFSDFTFGLGGNDILVLKDKNGKVQDSVNYDNDAPWPANADGTGMTIELINPILDNNLGVNWFASKSNLGTPGEQNSNYIGNISTVEVIDNKLNSKIEFVNNMLKVSSDELIQRIDLFDITGRKLSEFTIDNNRAEYNLSSYNSGLYIGTIVTKKGSQTFKLIIRK